MKMLSSFSLAPKQKITLVQVGGQKVLLGVSPEGISFLTTVDNANSITGAMASRAQGTFPQQGAFSQQGVYSQVGGQKAYLRGEGAATKPQATARKRVQSELGTEKRPRSVNGESQENEVPIPKQDGDPESHRAIDDVTKLIRKKLRNLPPI